MSSEIQKELISAAYEDSEHLNRIVGNLLEITRIETGAVSLHIKTCDLSDVVGAALQSLKNKIGQRTIIVQIPQDLPEIPMDFVLMMRVFVNLIDNAIKYSPPSMPIRILAVLKDKVVKVEIQDSGFGIADMDLFRIFEKFYRSSKSRQITGTGLCLSICKGIVEAHGGRIWAQNNEDKGASLSVELPLVRK